MSEATVPTVPATDLIRIMIDQGGKGSAQQEALVLNVHGLTVEQSAELQDEANKVVRRALGMRVDNYQQMLTQSRAALENFEEQTGTSNGKRVKRLPAPKKEKTKQSKEESKDDSTNDVDLPGGQAGELLKFIRQHGRDGVSARDQAAWSKKTIFKDQDLDDATASQRLSVIRSVLKKKGLIEQVSEERSANWRGTDSEAQASSGSGNGRQAESSNGLRPGTNLATVNDCVYKSPARGRTVIQIVAKTSIPEDAVRACLGVLMKRNLVENRGEHGDARYFPKGSDGAEETPTAKKGKVGRRRGSTASDGESGDEEETAGDSSVAIPDTPEAEVSYLKFGKRVPTTPPEWTWLFWKMLTDKNRKGRARFDDLVKAVKKESAQYCFNTSTLTPAVIHNGLMSGYKALIEAGDLAKTEDQQTVMAAVLAKKAGGRQKTAKASGKTGRGGANAKENGNGSTGSGSSKGSSKDSLKVDVNDLDFEEEGAWTEAVQRVLRDGKKKGGFTKDQIVEAIHGNGTVKHPHPSGMTRDACDDGVGGALEALLGSEEITQDGETEEYSLV